MYLHVYFLAFYMLLHITSNEGQTIYDLKTSRLKTNKQKKQKTKTIALWQLKFIISGVSHSLVFHNPPLALQLISCINTK